MVFTMTLNEALRSIASAKDRIQQLNKELDGLKNYHPEDGEEWLIDHDIASIQEAIDFEVLCIKQLEDYIKRFR